MTSTEWSSSNNPDELIEYLRETRRADPRKMRLYTCALARHFWDGLAHDSHRRLVELAEQFADGLISFSNLTRAFNTAVRYADEYRTEYDGADICPGRVVFETAANDPARGAWWAWGHAAQVCQHLPEVPLIGTFNPSALLRELFDNPWRPVRFDARWQTATTRALAERMYDVRDFSAMPILADALEEAGCNCKEILDHCRGSNTHVRGCWVVDLVLGKG